MAGRSYYRVPEDVVDKWIELRKMNLSYESIAKQTGYSKSSVIRKLRECGDKTDNVSAKRRTSDEKIEKMKAYRGMGLSNSQIAIELGVDVQTVRKYIGSQPTMLRAERGSLCAHVTGVSFISKRVIRK